MGGCVGSFGSRGGGGGDGGGGDGGGGGGGSRMGGGGGPALQLQSAGVGGSTPGQYGGSWLQFAWHHESGITGFVEWQVSCALPSMPMTSAI